MGIYRDPPSTRGVQNNLAGRLRVTHGVEKVQSLPLLWHRKHGLWPSQRTFQVKLSQHHSPV